MLKESKITPGSQIHLVVSSSLKEDAEELLKQMGLSMAEAVRLFLKQVVLEKAIPFAVKYSANIPNKKTIQAIEDADNGKVIKTDRASLRRMWEEM